jgi:hypothetical protein
MIFLSLHIDEARKSDNDFTVTLVPKAAYVEQAMQVVVKQLKELENGMIIFPTDSIIRPYVIFPRVALFTTDSQELCNLCHHRGPNSGFVCRCCFANRGTDGRVGNLADPSYDIIECENSRAYAQYQEFITALLKSDLSDKSKTTLARRISIKHDPWLRYYKE